MQRYEDGLFELWWHQKCFEWDFQRPSPDSRMVSTQTINGSGPFDLRSRSGDVGYSESVPIRSSCEISPPVSIDKAAKNSLISSSSTFSSSNFIFFEISTGFSQSFRRLNFNIPWFAGAFHTKSSFDII